VLVSKLEPDLVKELRKTDEDRVLECLQGRYAKDSEEVAREVDPDHLVEVGETQASS